MTETTAPLALDQPENAAADHTNLPAQAAETTVMETAEETSASLLAIIERAAANPAIEIEKMNQLLDMHERIMAKQAEAEFNAAMADAQAEMGRVMADSQNRQTGSEYASYAAVDRALRPVYTRHGFSLSFDTGEGAPENYVRVRCYVGHRGGHTRLYHLDMPADGKGAKGGDVMTKTHAVGSALTYAQRYLATKIFNLAIGDDDDGNGASEIEYITAEQKEQLVKLLRETDAHVAKFLAWLGVESLDLLPAGRFDEALQALERRRAKIEAARERAAKAAQEAAQDDFSDRPLTPMDAG